jgi:hypothetical protein
MAPYMEEAPGQLLALDLVVTMLRRFATYLAARR